MPHPDEHQIARYIDGHLEREARRALEAHLAGCGECRLELAEVRGLLSSRPGTRRLWRALVPVAAAAVLLLWSGLGPSAPSGTVTRDPAMTSTLAPIPLAPLGEVAAAGELVWAAVPGTDRYRVTLFSGEGVALWQASLVDTAVVVPDSLRLLPETPYFWQVKAETEYGRWVESELVEFLVEAGRR